MEQKQNIEMAIGRYEAASWIEVNQGHVKCEDLY